MNKYQRQILENQVALMKLLLPAETDKDIEESVKECREALSKSQKMIDEDTLHKKMGYTPL